MVTHPRFVLLGTENAFMSMNVNPSFSPRLLNDPLWYQSIVWTSFQQCCKFLSPGRPRLPGFGSGYLLPEACSPGGRPKMTISQLLIGLQNSITTQIAVQRVEQIHWKRNIFTFTNNFLIKRHFIYIRATKFWSGLPAFLSRPPAGLPPNYREFAMLQ